MKREVRPTYRAATIAPPEIEMLSTGIKAKIVPVPAYLVDKMVSSIRDPRPPKQFIEAKGRDEENPFDPTYLAEVDEARRLGGIVTLEALILFGVELADGLPDDDGWLDKLLWLSKRGHIDLSEYDLEDPSDREFCYKAFVAVSGLDLMKITMKSGMTSEEVSLAMDGFRGKEARPADQDSGTAPSVVDRTDGGSAV